MTLNDVLIMLDRVEVCKSVTRHPQYASLLISVDKVTAAGKAIKNLPITPEIERMCVRMDEMLDDVFEKMMLTPKSVVSETDSSGCSVKPVVIDSAIERYWKLRRESDMILLDIFEIARNAGEQKEK